LAAPKDLAASSWLGSLLFGSRKFSPTKREQSHSIANSLLAELASASKLR